MKRSTLPKNGRLPFRWKGVVGFTMLECLLVLALSCVLITAGVSATHRTVSHYVSASHLQRLSSLLSQARNKALMENAPITVCGSRDKIYCDASWNRFVLMKNKKHILHVAQIFSAQERVKLRGGFGVTARLVFSPEGSLEGQQGSFYYAPHASMPLVRRIVIARSGRVRS